MVKPKKFDESPKKFGRGYSSVRQRVNKNYRYNMSCFNCVHYYQAPGDKTEMCQNSSVLEYDLVVSENNTIYCTTHWSPLPVEKEPTSTVKGMFKG